MIQRTVPQWNKPENLHIYIVKVIGQEVYWRYDGTLTTNKSKAYNMEYSTAEKVINELNRIHTLREGSITIQCLSMLNKISVLKGILSPQMT